MSTTLDAVRIEVSDAERTAGALAPARLAEARSAMLGDGMVVLDGLVPVDIVESIAEVMYAEVDDLIATGRHHAGYPGQFNQLPPSDEAHLRREVLANPVVLQIVRSLLGPSVVSTLYQSNVNAPGSTAQRVHCDLPQLWPDLDPVHLPAYGMVCNLPLIDTNEGNATELWLGTHVDGRTNTSAGLHRDIPLEWLEERRVTHPPIRIPQEKGSVILRDVRLWHTGVANTSDDIRIMLGVGYGPAWYNGFVIPVPPAVAEAMERFGVPFAQSGAGGAAFMQELAASRASGFTS